MNMQKLMMEAQKMQAKLQKEQEELEKIRSLQRPLELLEHQEAEKRDRQNGPHDLGRNESGDEKAGKPQSLQQKTGAEPDEGIDRR